MSIIGAAMGKPLAKSAGRQSPTRSRGHLRAGQQRPAHLLNALLSRLDDVGVLAVTLHGKILTTNPAWWALLRRAGRHRPGAGFTAAFPPALRPHARSLVAALRQKTGPVGLDLGESGLRLEAARWQGGTLFLLMQRPAVSGSALRRAQGGDPRRTAEPSGRAVRPSSPRSSGRGHTVDALVEPSLVRERALTQKILDSLPLGLYVIDRNFTIVAWNRTRETAPWGMKREEVIGRNLFQVLPSLRRTRIEEEFQQVFETGATLQMEEETVLEGDRRTFRISKAPLTDGPGVVTHVITLVEDFTERRRIERQLLASEKLAGIGQLASGIAHELNNPMATIASCAEALLKQGHGSPANLRDGEEFQTYLRIIEEEVYRCKGILAGLSDLSREGSVEQRPIDLRGLLDGILGVLGYQLRSRGITVIRDFQDTLPPLLGNEGELRQAFLALLINAIEAMDRRGATLTIRAKAAGPGPRPLHASSGRVPPPPSASGVQAEIADTGGGIPADLLPRVFEPFFTTKPPGKGAGLGLYIAEGIIGAHGGRVEVDSVEGRGTIVRVHFPPAKAHVGERR